MTIPHTTTLPDTIKERRIEMAKIFERHPEFQHEYTTWWRGLSLKGDPIRRPYLTEEAFLAGAIAALKLLGEAEQRRTASDAELLRQSMEAIQP